MPTQAPKSQETMLKDLDGLLDMLFAPQHRRNSETLKERVIECLMNMREPSEGAELILKRIEPHIAGAEHAQYKASLEEIQDVVQSMTRPRPR